MTRKNKSRGYKAKPSPQATSEPRSPLPDEEDPNDAGQNAPPVPQPTPIQRTPMEAEEEARQTPPGDKGHQAHTPPQAASTTCTPMKGKKERKTPGDQGQSAIPKKIPITGSDAPISPVDEIPIEELDLDDKEPLPACVRPDFGVLGKPIELIANCFRIKVPDIMVYHYDVQIRQNSKYEKQLDDIATSAPEVKKYRCIGTKKNRRIVNALIQQLGDLRSRYPAYDGRKNLYTRKPLKGSPFERSITLETDGKSESFVVSVKAVNEDEKRVKDEKKTFEINLSSINAIYEGKVSDVDQSAFMALETILRHTPCVTLTPIGRSFFSPPRTGNECSIGGGQEIWFGYHQSVKLGQWGPLINLDISATSFYEEGPIVDHLTKSLGEDITKQVRINNEVIQKLSKEMRNLRIKTTHTNRLHKVIGVTKVPASKLKFKHDSGSITVSEYFLQRYNKQLKYPFLPCLQVDPEKKQIFLPVEFCTLVAGQHSRKELSGEQKANMITFTTISPRDRFGEIRRIANNAKFNSDNTCREFNIAVDLEPVKLTGRTLIAPTICYEGQAPTKPSDGQWDMRGKNFSKSGVVQRWVVLSFTSVRDCPRNALTRFAGMLVNICAERGLRMSGPDLIVIFDNRSNTVASTLKNIKESCTPSFVLVVVHRDEKKLYGEVKRIAETNLDLMTQCIKHDNVTASKPALIRNLSLKLNTKLGGINSEIKSVEKPLLLNKPIIIIGADVTHPSPTEPMQFSIASVVGSMDRYPSRYAVTCRTQVHSTVTKTIQEVIKDLESIITELLRTFRRKTLKAPEKIIFYRDGVSEGQFEEVREKEVKAIRRACQGLSRDYQPAITYIVVQKRHHIRFHMPNPPPGCRSRNVPAGTTVDTVVTNPLNFDFIQVSHNSPLGTARPAYYTVLEDDNKFKADELQKLTNQLCYTYARCTKSIAIPAPVMYAHLAAFRARQWLLSQARDDNRSDSSSDSNLQTAMTDGANIFRGISNISDSMFFV